MFQIIFYGGIDIYEYQCFRDNLHRTIRLRVFFDLDVGSFITTVTVEANYHSTGEYETNVKTAIYIVNSKLFIFQTSFTPTNCCKTTHAIAEDFPLHSYVRLY